MRGELAKIDPYFEQYMDNLLKDIQKLRQHNDGWSKILNWTRWAGSSAALALNPKVLVTQTVSLASALSEFDAKYVVKGLSKFFSKTARIEVAKYAPLMAERMEVGNSVDIVELRQNNNKIGKVGKIISFLTKPISWMDSNVVASLWQASLYETSNKLGKPITSEDVKVEAGKRLQEVVFKTQQSFDTLARSAIMRNPNEMVKALRMFHGDSFQLFSRMYSAVNKNRVAKRMIKSNDSSIVKKGEALLKQSKTELRKVGTAFTMNMLMLVAIAEAFKWFKGNEKDEPFTSESMWNELMGNILGMIPLGSELNNVMNGYDVSNMSYSALSNIYTAMKELMDGIDSLAKGEHVDATEVRKTWRKVMLGLSQTFGVPLRNLETYSKAIIGKISPATREEYEALFGLKSNKSYLDKISSALDNGDEDMADRLVNIMFNAKTGKIKNDEVMEITRDLINKGYNVLPKTLSATITYNNQQIELTKKQYAEFKKIYEQSNDIITKMVNSSNFKKLNEEAKARSMKITYDYYYNLGLENLIGEMS